MPEKVPEYRKLKQINNVKTGSFRFTFNSAFTSKIKTKKMQSCFYLLKHDCIVIYLLKNY